MPIAWFIAPSLLVIGLWFALCCRLARWITDSVTSQEVRAIQRNRGPSPSEASPTDANLPGVIEKLPDSVGLSRFWYAELVLLPVLFLAPVGLVLVVGLIASLGRPAPADKTYKPVQWTEFERVEGQSEPVPVQWLQDPEARVAHSLKLPDAVPKSVPFDFRTAYWRGWIPGKPNQALQYFNHLCNTEAGQWVFKTVKDVEGLYFARPPGMLASGVMTDPHGPEMPWIQRIVPFYWSSLHDQGAMFVYPPFSNYRFVEQPRRDVKWQEYIEQPYVRYFGFTQEMFVKPGQVVEAMNERTPMQIVGIPAPTARYGYTWRGIKRERDRELGIAGGEALIYDLQTREVLAVRRQFQINRVAGWCPQLKPIEYSGEFKQFAFDVLQTIEPSTTGKRKP